MIEFKKVSGNAPVTDYLTRDIGGRLKRNESILWLVAGGSAMDVAVNTARNLKDYPNLSKLAITLTDERFGAPGHADSNWKQLSDRGFELPGARMLPVLTGSELESTVSAYQGLLETELAGADFSIALAGMGADGHIFGIKPRSPAVSSDESLIGYDWDDFRRITPTLAIIKELDEIVVYAAGAKKHPQIDKLAGAAAADEQPAQLLKQAGKTIFFNDYKGEQI